jgi:hypothetical protein
MPSQQAAYLDPSLNASLLVFTPANGSKQVFNPEDSKDLPKSCKTMKYSEGFQRGKYNKKRNNFEKSRNKRPSELNALFRQS